jgi:hypothetical protein
MANSFCHQLLSDAICHRQLILSIAISHFAVTVDQLPFHFPAAISHCTSACYVQSVNCNLPVVRAQAADIFYQPFSSCYLPLTSDLVFSTRLVSCHL